MASTTTPLHGGPAPHNPQLTQQFLSNVLSQRGPSSLPYSEDVKRLIRHHLLTLSEAIPSMQPRTATYTHNDGRTVNLLQACGTVPMDYMGVTYQIPIIIWLIENYPRHPPCVYVNPTRDMIIKRPHPFVNPSGAVSIPYLQNWIYPSSNLVDLCRNLGQLFGRDPPLYTQRRVNPSTNPGIGSTVSQQSFNSNAVSSGPRPVSPLPRVYQTTPSPYGPAAAAAGSRLSQHQQVQRADDPAEVFRRNAINKLVDMAHKDVIGLTKSREGEMEGLFNVQGVLRQREGQLAGGLRDLLNEKEGLEQQLQMILMNADVVEAWLRENQGKVRNVGNVDVDDVFQPCDPLSKQLIETTSSDLGIEDAIYSLDKALQDGAVSFDQYLRTVRSLSREQFMHRATIAKIKSMQMQAQVSNMAARTSRMLQAE
uniref:Uncharacterized protein n=1 Tax=Kalanchoe fedtschenkoi TaxID=63787 RepID=A0A7N0TQA4_KALFE